MKFSVPRIFDISLINKAKSFAEFEKFFDYMNQFTDNTVRCFLQGLGVDNLDSEHSSQSYTHNTEVIRTIKKKPRLVILGGSTKAVSSYSWQYTEQAKLSITVNFVDTTTKNQVVNFLIMFS